MKTRKLFIVLIAMISSLVFMLSGCQVLNKFLGKNDTQAITVGFDLNFRTVADDPENIEVTPGEAYGELPVVDVENEGYTFLALYLFFA